MKGSELRIEVVVVLVLGVLATASYCATVTYDHRALVIDGKRRVLVSGSIHYPRSTPEVLFLLLCFSFFIIIFLNFFNFLSELLCVYIDVAGPYSEIQGRRLGCH